MADENQERSGQTLQPLDRLHAADDQRHVRRPEQQKADELPCGQTEREPADGDLPASAAADILPQADVVAITGMSLVNHTLDDLLELRSPEAKTLLLGASTPLSPVLFEYGIDFLSGSIVTAIDPVLAAVRQGANFRQIHKAGVRLVTMQQMI